MEDHKDGKKDGTTQTQEIGMITNTTITLAGGAIGEETQEEHTIEF